VKIYLAFPRKVYHAGVTLAEKLRRDIDGLEVKVPFEGEAATTVFEKKFAWPRMTKRERKEIVRRDLVAISEVDVVVVFLPVLGIGTLIELAVSRHRGKPTFVLASPEYSEHPWLEVFAHVIVTDYTELRRTLERFQKGLGESSWYYSDGQSKTRRVRQDAYPRAEN